VRVIVDPWADVYVDGRKVDTTPLQRPLALPEGHHRLELRNELLVRSESRDIQVQRGTTQTVRVALQR
jgi:hypothetical protein